MGARLRLVTAPKWVVRRDFVYYDLGKFLGDARRSGPRHPARKRGSDTLLVVCESALPANWIKWGPRPSLGGSGHISRAMHCMIGLRCWRVGMS